MFIPVSKLKSRRIRGQQAPRAGLISILKQFFVFSSPSWVDYTEENEFLGADVLDPLSRAGGYVYGVARADLGGFVIDVHAA